MHLCTCIALVSTCPRALELRPLAAPPRSANIQTGGVVGLDGLVDLTDVAVDRADGFWAEFRRQDEVAEAFDRRVQRPEVVFLHLAGAILLDSPNQGTVRRGDFLADGLEAVRRGDELGLVLGPLGGRIGGLGFPLRGEQGIPLARDGAGAGGGEEQEDEGSQVCPSMGSASPSTMYI